MKNDLVAVDVEEEHVPCLCSGQASVRAIDTSNGRLPLLVNMEVADSLVASLTM